MSPYDLPTPALLLDLAVLRRNVERMAARMQGLGVRLRPHLKTHKCVEVARLQERHGAAGFTVSTLAEAAAFAAAGFTDLTWAFPLITSRLDEVRAILDRGTTLRLTVDTPEAVDALEASGLGVHVWLEVDCGDHRSGVDPASTRARDLARRLHDSPRLAFDGLLTHAGQSYQARGRQALAPIAEDERRVMAELADALRADGLAVPAVSVGSTPTMAAVTDLTGVTEARPGNYVFHDLMQCGIGSCTVADCALTVLASVVSAQPGASHSVIDAGALSLSKDVGLGGEAPPTYGRVLREDGELEPDLRLVGLSQEHGKVDRALPVGSRLRVLMNHSCLAVPNFPCYHVVEDGRVVDRWPILR